MTPYHEISGHACNDDAQQHGHGARRVVKATIVIDVGSRYASDALTCAVVQLTRNYLTNYHHS